MFPWTSNGPPALPVMCFVRASLNWCGGSSCALQSVYRRSGWGAITVNGGSGGQTAALAANRSWIRLMFCFSLSAVFCALSRVPSFTGGGLMRPRLVRRESPVRRLRRWFVMTKCRMDCSSQIDARAERSGLMETWKIHLKLNQL